MPHKRSPKKQAEHDARNQAYYDIITRELICMKNKQPYWKGEVLQDSHGTGSFDLEDRQQSLIDLE